jgi:hypothetical protein
MAIDVCDFRELDPGMTNTIRIHLRGSYFDAFFSDFGAPESLGSARPLAFYRIY